MGVVQLMPRLHFLRLEVGHAYLWRDPDGLTLVDASSPGSGAELAAAIRGLGHDVAEVRRVVLTHCHIDHAGAVPEIVGWGDVEVAAHRLDAAVLRGDAEAEPPNLAGWEKPLFDRIVGPGPLVPTGPVRVDRELDDGDVLDFGGGAVTIAVPGHTAGSVAFYLPGPRVLFAGDAVVRAVVGERRPVILGAFNVDTVRAAESLRRLAELDVEIACFGHGEPATSGAAAQLRAAAARPPRT